MGSAPCRRKISGKFLMQKKNDSAIILSVSGEDEDGILAKGF
jgi:hypothetical protein